uniref:BTB domain-containing protein n=1 Tax=Panagrellus redivivus TaxID=6233 RepID=A0A7E4WEC6_PANRE
MKRKLKATNVAVFECFTEKYESVVNISLSESFLDKCGNKFETPLCFFDGLDGVSFSVVASTFDGSSGVGLIIKVNSKLILPLLCSCGTAKPVVGRKGFGYIADTSNFRKDGKVSLTVTVTYETNPYGQTATSNSLQLQTYQLIGNDGDSTDAKIVVGWEEIKVHRAFLSMVSPVFKAMFAHNTKESKDGIITIKDMDPNVVKESINLLYGHNVELKTIPQVIGILQFFEKYLIKGATERLESWISEKLNLADFAAVIRHAWNYSSENLQKRCRGFFRNNTHFALSEGYRQLSLDIVVSLSANDAEKH